MCAFRSYHNQSTEKTFRYKGFIDYSNNFGGVDMLLYHLDSYSVLLTETSTKGQNNQCILSALMVLNTIGKPGLAQQNNFSDLLH